MIKLINVSKKYKNTYALKNVNLNINAGEFVFLTGASGAGKSTLMKLLYREETPSNGVVTIGNVNVANLPNYKVPNLRRCMGIVFQDYKLLHNQSVYDNVAYVIRTLGYSSREIEARVLGALKIVDLDNKIKAKASELSGGEQQRVALARAMIKPSKIILADEPTGALDSKNRDEVLQLLREINKQRKTIVIVTHDMTVANSCDRIIQL